ncbi:Uma2 family endonuclease [Laspinema sp. A4]|uniref:Uma2 family endonuclease n=1 Tax=Laspinema sp. D2d TaxID=2953686 RepID=UPI0021BB4E9B|nr:Uma2 family endonuclease [Laspinema sp. D2d]MCT7985988.1 Uma2 family endonuclease [Laspinema sp. D2d]
MSRQSSVGKPNNRTEQQLLPLENGDRLTRPEFERRYHAMPNCKKAELIEGVVYMPSPVRFSPHAEPHGLLITWLGVYRSMTPGVRLGDNATIRLDLDNEPQPDALLRLEESLGGESRLTDDDYVEGPPEFIAEIAASTATYDLHDKKQVYRRNGVQEYLVWRVSQTQLDWFRLTEGEYIPIEPDENGVLRSLFFPGLWLDSSKLLSGNFSGVLAVLQEGLSSPEHADFVKQLSKTPQN